MLSPIFPVSCGATVSRREYPWWWQTARMPTNPTVSPPQLQILPTEEMVRSGHIERLFTTGIVRFDPATRSVSVKE